MKIDGIQGCYVKTGALFYFARMCPVEARAIKGHGLHRPDGTGFQRRRRADETAEFIPATIRACGLADNGQFLTDFDLIEMDEGRWSPEIWRDAWK